MTKLLPRSVLAVAVLATAGVRAQNNVLLIIADDMGTEYVGAYEPAVQFTPNIKALAQLGMRFDNCWASAVCSPSRAALLTGKYPIHNGVRRVVRANTPCCYSGPANQAYTVLQHAEKTLPELLNEQASTYQHSLIGKWHLDVPNCSPWGPGQHGFRWFYGTPAGVQNYCSWLPHTAVLGSNPVAADTPTQNYSTTELVDKALAWIGDRSGPWFCVLSFHAPHSPYQCPPASLAPTQTANCGQTCVTNHVATYRAMVEAMDSEIGRLCTQLGWMEQLEDTYIIFTSDNGTPMTAAIPPDYVNDESLLRGCTRTKGTPYQGGVQVPLIIAGPNIDPNGSTNSLVHLVDLYPTIAEFCGVTSGLPAGLDGMSLSAVLGGASTHHPIVATDMGAFELGTNYTGECRPYQGDPQFGLYTGFCAARDGRYKLIRYHDAPLSNCLPHDATTLEAFYDLLLDPTERNRIVNPSGTEYDDLADHLDMLCEGELEQCAERPR